MVKPMRPDTDAIRDWIKRGMSTGPVDTIELCDEIDRQATVITGLVDESKELTEAIKKECDYRDELIEQVDKLTADNKALQERGTAIQKVNVKFKRQINKLTEQNGLMVLVLERNLKDMDRIDEICKLARFHPFTQMRADIADALDATGEPK